MSGGACDASFEARCARASGRGASLRRAWPPVSPAVAGRSPRTLAARDGHGRGVPALVPKAGDVSPASRVGGAPHKEGSEGCRAFIFNPQRGKKVNGVTALTPSV